MYSVRVEMILRICVNTPTARFLCFSHRNNSQSNYPIIILLIVSHREERRIGRFFAHSTDFLVSDSICMNVWMCKYASNTRIFVFGLGEARTQTDLDIIIYHCNSFSNAHSAIHKTHRCFQQTHSLSRWSLYWPPGSRGNHIHHCGWLREKKI